MDPVTLGMAKADAKKKYVSIPKITGFSPALVAGVSTSSHPTVLGAARPYDLVTVYLNGTAAGTAAADASGNWAIPLAAQLNGTFNLIARAAPASPSQSLVINDPKQPLQNVAGVPAVFELDNLRGLYYTNGVVYGDLAGLVAALGAASSGAAFSVGGYTDPAATNLLTNGTFDTNTTGWTANGSGALASVSGELQFTINAAGDTFSQAVTGYQGRAFCFTGVGRKGSIASNIPQLAVTLQNQAFGANISTGPNVGTTNTAAKLFTSASGSGGSTWFGVRGSSGLGAALFDNFFVSEAMPLPGWTSFATSSSSPIPQFSALIDAVTPSALPSTGQSKVIWQVDANSESAGVVVATQHNALRLVWNDDGSIHFIKRVNGSTSFDLNLGTVAVNTRFRVALGAAAGVNADSNTGFAASLNGANSQVQATAADYMVGFSHMRIGQNPDGTSLWDGTINRVAVVRDRQTNDWLEYQATLPSATPRVFAGDSYIGGAGGVVLPNIYEAGTSQISYNIGVGGSTFQQQVGYITTRPYLRDLPMIVWDGSNNGMVDVASQMALAQQIWDWKANGRILWIPSLAVPNPGNPSSSTPTGSSILLRQYRDALIAAFGAAHVYDPVPVLQALSTGSADDLNDIAAGLVPRSIMITQNPGEVHLSTAAMTAIANDSTFRSKIAAL